ICGSCMTSGAVRTGAHGTRFALARANTSILQGAGPFSDHRVGFVHMRDAVGIRPEARIVGQFLAPHRLQEIAPVTLGDDVDRGMPVSAGDRKSTRLNSSHRTISYAVFCLKKNKSKRCTVGPDCVI